jgi:hypothetical protein
MKPILPTRYLPRLKACLASATLFTALLLITPAHADDRGLCSLPNAPHGPCIQCAVEFDAPADLLGAPPLYWDICGGAHHADKIIYFLPQSISVVIRGGKALQALRRRGNDLFLAASLNYHPWGRATDLNQSALLKKLQQTHNNLRFMGITPERYQTRFLGEWQSWVKSVKLTPLSGMDLFQDLRVEIVFHKQHEEQVKQALKRKLGLLGEITFEFKGYRKDGTALDVRYPFAFYLGQLEMSGP